MTDSTADFTSLGLESRLVETLGRLGYEAPTPIQQKTIPLLLEGRDLIGQAQTGTGKTAAFALPMLQKIDRSTQTTQALVLTPTRELAIQVAEAIHTYAQGTGFVSVQPIYGGAPISLQIKHLKRGVQIVVGTPGRLIDHLNRKSLSLSSISMLVLDEADEMLRMGFIDDVERILSEAPKERQIALFSATMPQPILRIAKTHLRDPESVKIEHRGVAAPAIEQKFLNVSQHQKLTALTQILELEQSEGVLIFTRTKLGAADLSEKLQARGFASAALHGDMTQAMREAVVRRMRKGEVEIVVATDVAARGLDVDQITHVVNYDIPNDVDAYIHRIGRTGRAGRSGTATLFVTPREKRMMRDIEKHTGTSITPMKMPTRADVSARRVAILKEGIAAQIEQGDLDLYRNLVTELSTEGPHDLTQIAAAAARLASSAASFTPLEEAIPEIAPERPRDRDQKGKRGAPPRADKRRDDSKRAPKAFDRKRRDEPKVQLMMGIGKEAGIRPADVVGSIANEADIPGSDIGPIDIRDDFTLVTIPERYERQVVGALKAARFKGKPFDIRTARPGLGRPPAGGVRDRGKPPKGTVRGGARSGRPAGKTTSGRSGAGPRKPVKRK
ncbi:MAG: DEAD/DEAH box helicase [Acidobacteria bacterium]|nr:DEAD/DEAH box helicase [Acidobacteriota bacterium]